MDEYFQMIMDGSLVEISPGRSVKFVDDKEIGWRNFVTVKLSSRGDRETETLDMSPESVRRTIDNNAQFVKLNNELPGVK